MTPIETWLAGARKLTAPRLRGASPHDELLSIDVEREMALVKLKLQVPPRYLTDMLLCLRVGGAWKIVQTVTAIETR